jgi:hypothetical protein
VEQLGRYAVNKRWMMAASGRLYFFLNHLTLYPRRCIPLGPHTRRVSMRGDCQVELEFVPPHPSHRLPIAPFSTGTPPGLLSPPPTQIGGEAFLSANTTGGEALRLLCLASLFVDCVLTVRSPCVDCVLTVC